VAFVELMEQLIPAVGLVEAVVIHEQEKQGVLELLYLELQVHSLWQSVQEVIQ
jgi:hypothetical protein